MATGIGNRRTWAVGAAAVLLMSTVLAGRGAPEVGAVAPPYPIYEVPTPEEAPTGWFLPIRDVSRDGRFATMLTSDGSVRHFTLPLGDFVVDTPPGQWDPASGGVFGYYSTYNSFPADLVQAVKRWRLATGEVETIPVPLADPSIVVGGVTAADPSGRYLVLRLVRSTWGDWSPAFFDTLSGDLSEPFGEWWGAAGAPVATAVSRDGRFVSAQQPVYDQSPPQVDYLQLDRTTGMTARRSAPPQADPGRPFVASTNLDYSLFVSEEAGVVPGFDATSRLYLRNHRSNVTVAVPVDASTALRYVVDDTGRVIISHVVPRAAAPDAIQLSTWTPGGTLQLLTIGLDGEPADDGISRRNLPFVVSDDGRRVTFTSEATNLVASGSPPLERMFQIVLPRRVLPLENGARVAADESTCVGVPGAVPGEFVGLNVTPVNATAPGYGVAHSSDERARTTSNVNFGPGTVDPNVAFVKVGVDSDVCVTNSRHGAVDIVIDAMTVAGTATLRTPVPAGPQRLLDTRQTEPLQPSGIACVRPGGVALDEFVGVNITPVGAVAAGFATAHAAGASPGGSSTVNFGPGTVDPNFAFVPVGAELAMCVTNSVHGPIDAVIDLQVLGAATLLRAPATGLDGLRAVDTRIGLGSGRLAPSGSVCFSVPGAAVGETVGVNIAVVDAITPGFGTLHSSDNTPGGVSNVNFGSGTVDPNFAMTQVGADGKVCFTNSVHGEVDVVIDAQVIGAADAFRLPSADGSVRILDTREARP